MRQGGRKIGRDRISSVKSVWKECSFSSAQFQTPHRAKGSRGRYGLLPRECLSRSRKVAEREGEREEEKKGGGGGLVGRSGAQSVGVSRLPSVLSPTRSVDRSTPCCSIVTRPIRARSIIERHTPSTRQTTIPIDFRSSWNPRLAAYSRTGRKLVKWEAVGEAKATDSAIYAAKGESAIVERLANKRVKQADK